MHIKMPSVSPFTSTRYSKCKVNSGYQSHSFYPFIALVNAAWPYFDSADAASLQSLPNCKVALEDRVDLNPNNKSLMRAKSQPT